MSVTDEMLQSNEDHARSFSSGDLPGPPARKVAVVACMDARLNPYAMLGLREGDAHVIRNAGGVVTDDVIRSPSRASRRARSCPTSSRCAASSTTSPPAGCARWRRDIAGAAPVGSRHE
jgi:hypothetical protein